MDREQDQKRVRESMKAGGRRQEAEGKLIALSFFQLILSLMAFLPEDFQLGKMLAGRE
ncbi:hypothetical protein IQ274_02370 [Nostoc sp. LEGE 12447]|uniref:hypothetical protein n=1 Tax=Nostoc sp. LEGE 12447 TaxID=1828640 RepID=UPI00187F1014|nr:hypothetical protein [Nostoc sp. LEGE 12447]MBE8997091.1 hypothetical protein [Nostoc sp. LEGE 12447]